MVEDGDENFSDFVNEEDYEFMQKDITMPPLDIMTSHHVMTSVGNLDPMMMNMMNAEDTTLSMEEFKYLNQNYLQPPMPNFPPSEPKNLCNKDYAGPLNFEVFVDPNGLKNPWEYSPMLNKIYIDMKHKFPINFSVKAHPEESLFVRVMPMFEEDRYFHEIVHRCISHEQPKELLNQGIMEHVTQHIMRCDNNNAQYFGDKNAGKRLSVVIPLSSPQAGTDSVKEFFQFVCKSSCPGGMSRRPIQVIFSLEDQYGEVLGRRVLCVRICSCPKRDREKEEKKKEKQEDPPGGKKRRVEKKMPPSTETTDTKLCQLNVTLVGERNLKKAAEYCRALMTDEVFKLESKNGDDTPYRKCITELNKIIDKGSD